MNGVQCMSPALKWRRLCFFHNRIRCEQARNAKDESTQRRFELPLLEDANSVQMALMKVMQMLGSGRLDHKTAGLMLYALQTASCNLRNLSFEPAESTDVVIDRDDIHRTYIGGQQWFEEDFEEEEQAEDQNEEENDADGTDDEAVAAAPAQPAAISTEAAPAKKVPAPAKHITTEEARMKVQGVVRNWLLETMGGTEGAKPPG